MEDEGHNIQSVSNILKEVILNIHQSCQDSSSQVRSSLKWENLADKTLAKGSYVKSIHEGVMIIACKHSIYLQLVTMQKRRILQVLRKNYPSLAIVDIRGVLDTVETIKEITSHTEKKEETDMEKDLLFEQIIMRIRRLGKEGER
ncbi:DUF721 domain-containing protein [Entomospira nematocerorum]|nr:DUF721 domain-containing protein [Entomospira nematocera]WDI34518.1 DUF721 domain-containing protein [Entomospira nematocera]